MSQEFMEPEEGQQKETVFEAPNPLDEAVNEKVYTRPNASFTATELNTPIAEPSFNPPPQPKEKAKQEPFNPDLKDVSGKDKELAASYVANMIMDGYELVHVLANNALIFNEKKLAKLERNGDIDLSLPIQYGSQQISLGEFISKFNQNNTNLLKVTPEFRQEVMPVLIKVLEKRGAGMTDEQYLMFLFAKDIGVKSIIAFQAIGEMREMKNVMIEHTRMMKEMMSRGQMPPTMQATPPPPQPEPHSPEPQTYTPPTMEPQQYEQEPEEYVQHDSEKTANDLVNEMTTIEGHEKKRGRKPKVRFDENIDDDLPTSPTQLIN